MEPALQFFLWLLAAVLIVIGLAGLILPALPGIPLVFIGLLLLASALIFSPRRSAQKIRCLVPRNGRRGIRRAGRDILRADRHRAGPLRRRGGGRVQRQDVVKAAMHAGVGATLGLLFGTLLKIALAFTMIGIFVIDRLLS